MAFWFLADIYKYGSCQEEDVYGVDWMYGKNTIRASNMSTSALGGTGEVRAVFLFCMVHGCVHECTPAITSSSQHRCTDMNRRMSLESPRLEEQLDV